MTSIYDRIHRRSIIRRLVRVFEHSVAASGRSLPIRKTGRGIWAGTPVRVVAEAEAILGELGLLDDTDQVGPGHVIDAGSGDGRVSAVLGSLKPSMTICGIEADSTLHARATANLLAVAEKGLIDPARVQLAEADYCDAATYRTRGIAPERIALILNYPDGNQHHLARFITKHCGHDTTLCLLTHNRTLEIDELDLYARHDVRDGTGPPWRLSLYRRP